MRPTQDHAAASPVGPAIITIDWPAVTAAMDAGGWALVPGLLSAEQCDDLCALYDVEASFRSRVVMQRHGFGRGEYKYFAYPLPPLVQTLRSTLYPPLGAIANRWHEWLNDGRRFPPQHGDFLDECHEAGQPRPTPLLLRYGAGDFNCLHQDLYGPRVFPIQLAVLLSSPMRDFTGGEFVLTEQRPRAQSRVTVVPLDKGDAVVFAVDARPSRGVRGYHRRRLRHGVSEVRSGRRHTLGVIFHDAP